MKLPPEWLSLRLVLTAVVILLLVSLFTGCAEDMENQPRYEPLEASELFPDGQSSRVLLAELVPRSAYDPLDRVYTGVEKGALLTTIPLPLSAELLEGGQEQYNIFCSPCHGLTGYGNSMIVQRGFPRPPTLHSERLRQTPDGHYFHVISKGFGVMFE